MMINYMTSSSSSSTNTDSRRSSDTSRTVNVPIQPKEEEISINSVDIVATEECFEEEEEEYFSESSEVCYVELFRELECMKQRVLMLEAFVKKETGYFPKETCPKPKILATCSKNKEICALQKIEVKFQCQIDELVKGLEEINEQITDLLFCLCDKEKRVLELQKLIFSLMEWRDTLSHEAAKCIERFEHLKHVLSEEPEIRPRVIEENITWRKEIETLQLKSVYDVQMRYLHNTFGILETVAKEMMNYYLRRFSTGPMDYYTQNASPEASSKESMVSNVSSPGDSTTSSKCNNEGEE